MSEHEEILKAVTELGSKIDAEQAPTLFGLSEVFWGVILGTIIGSSISFIGTWLNNRSIRKRDAVNRLRSAYDDVVNTLAEVRTLHLRSRVLNVVQGGVQKDGQEYELPPNSELLKRDAFEEIQIMVENTKVRNGHLLPLPVVEALEKITCLPWHPCIARTHVKTDVGEQEIEIEVVPVISDWPRLIGDVQAAIKNGYP